MNYHCSSPSEASTSGGEEMGSSGELAAAERELRLRYHHIIYGALDKQVRIDQQHQMKSLTVSCHKNIKRL